MTRLIYGSASESWKFLSTRSPNDRPQNRIPNVSSTTLLRATRKCAFFVGADSGGEVDRGQAEYHRHHGRRYLKLERRETRKTPFFKGLVALLTIWKMFKIAPI
jgi:hypothetical protein